jgi:hypothetical protein
MRVVGQIQRSKHCRAHGATAGSLAVRGRHCRCSRQPLALLPSLGPACLLRPDVGARSRACRPAEQRDVCWARLDERAPDPGGWALRPAPRMHAIIGLSRHAPSSCSCTTPKAPHRHWQRTGIEGLPRQARALHATRRERLRRERRPLHRRGERCREHRKGARGRARRAGGPRTTRGGGGGAAHFFLATPTVLPRRPVVLVCWPLTRRPQ